MNNSNRQERPHREFQPGMKAGKLKKDLRIKEEQARKARREIMEFIRDNESEIQKQGQSYVHSQSLQLLIMTSRAMLKYMPLCLQSEHARQRCEILDGIWNRLLEIQIPTFTQLCI